MSFIEVSKIAVLAFAATGIVTATLPSANAADRARIISVRNAQIYTFVKGSSSDVRRECALPANARNVPRDSIFAQGVPRTSRYHVWHRSVANTCENDRAIRIR